MTFAPRDRVHWHNDVRDRGTVLRTNEDGSVRVQFERDPANTPLDCEPHRLSHLNSIHARAAHKAATQELVL